jgi:hypothetical protein
MAKFLLKEAFVQLDGVDLSDHCFSLETPSEKEVVDVSGFNPAGTKESLVGQRDDRCTIGALQDFAAGSVHATMYPCYSTDKPFQVKIRPKKSLAASATNPQYRGYGLLATYNGLSGELNARSEVSLEIVAAPGSSFVWSAT